MSDTTTYTEEDTYFTLEADGFGSSTFPVLNCGSADFASKSMTSYLRIGAVPGAEPGDELLDLLQHAGPPGDPVRDDFVHDTTNGQSFTTARTETEANASGNREVLFIDDVRDHSDDATVAGHHLSKHQRQLESAKLKTRGGWREHTDGNRIITTYGDKIEVVRGHYKKIVMGRQDDTGEAHGWDVGGAHIQDFAPGTMPGASVYQEFIPDYDGNGAYDKGVYLLVNSTENVWEYARNAGNFRTENWGDLHETYTGSENPVDISTCSTDGSEGHPQDDDDGDADHTGARPPWSKTGTGIVRSNPHIIEKTWATQIESHTGSSTLPVPEIVETMYADKLTEKLCVGGLTEALVENAKILAPGVPAGGGGGTNEILYWNETNVIGNEMGLTNTLGICKIELRHVLGVPGIIIEETACAQYTQCKSAVVHLDFDIGFMLNVFVGYQLEVNIGAENRFNATRAELNGLRQDASLMEGNLEAIKTEIAANKDEFSVQDTNLSTTTRRIHLADIQTGALIFKG